MDFRDQKVADFVTEIARVSRMTIPDRMQSYLPHLGLGVVVQLLREIEAARLFDRGVTDGIFKEGESLLTWAWRYDDWRNAEPVDPRPIVLDGTLLYESTDDGGKALVARLDDSLSEHIFVRVQSWDESHKAADKKHEMLRQFIGKKVRVTIEVIGEP